MKLLKTIFALLLAVSVPVGAQSPVINWQYSSPERDGLYGIDLEKAYAMLDGLKPRKEIVVAIIGTGMDIEHEDLKGSVWVNKKEKADGRDNDKNGKTDDLHGWNFIGNESGEVLEDALGFGDREFLRLKNKYDNIFTDDGKFYMIRNDGSELIPIDPPADIGEYNYYIKEIRPSSQLSSTYGGLYLLDLTRYYCRSFAAQMKELFSDKEDYTREEFLEIAKLQNDYLAKLAATMINIAFSANTGTSTWNQAISQLNSTKGINENKYQNMLVKRNIDDRTLVGDDPYDIKDDRYGNDVLLTDNSGDGTLFAGIVAARGSNGVGIDGIAQKARIMALRITPSEGDWIPKDLALSIRYAVDNKAGIILLPSSLTVNVYGDQKRWVEEALLYAASKDVLIIQPVNDMSFDLDDEYFFPSRKSYSGAALPNIITVAASDENGNPLLETNYGRTGLDIFAPGKDIYSTYVGDTYRMKTGSDMAGAVTAGVAALIRSYFPKLTAGQTRDAIINSVTARHDVEVEKQIMVKQNESARAARDLFLFDELCASGGIINAAGAVSEAAKMSGTKN